MLHVAHLCVNASITAASHKDQAYVRKQFAHSATCPECPVSPIVRFTSRTSSRGGTFTFRSRDEPPKQATRSVISTSVATALSASLLPACSFRFFCDVSRDSGASHKQRERAPSAPPMPLSLLDSLSCIKTPMWGTPAGFAARSHTNGMDLRCTPPPPRLPSPVGARACFFVLVE